MKGIRAVLFQTVLRNVPYLNLHKRVLETGDTIKNISRSDSHHPNDENHKNDEKCFLFHLKSSFPSQDI